MSITGPRWLRRYFDRRMKHQDLPRTAFGPGDARYILIPGFPRNNCFGTVGSKQAVPLHFSEVPVSIVGRVKPNPVRWVNFILHSNETLHVWRSQRSGGQ